MLKKIRWCYVSVSIIALVTCMTFVVSTNMVFAAEKLPALTYKGESKSVAPNWDRVQTVTAVPWLKISDKSLQLEGLIFDREKNLYLCEVFNGQVFKVTMPDKKITTILGPNKLVTAAVKIHKNGRLFLCGLGNLVDKGPIVSINPDGSDMQTIVPDTAGYLPDDMVFDKKGGFYFTDFKGYATNPIGGVYYVSPDFQTITPILKNMAIANGIALSKNERVLWVTEVAGNRLIRVNLMPDGVTIAPFGAAVMAHFSGFMGPDSAMIDADDNLYVAMYGQGKVFVFNKEGNQIGQILVPGRETGHMLRTTSMAIIPGTNQILISTNDMDNNGASWIYTAKVFGKEWTGQYQYQE